eukprot:gene12059-19962_t
MPPIFDVESLLLLVDEGDLDGVSALVAHKGEGVVQTKDEWGLTSLHLASATGNEDMVELLLSFNAKVNATTLIGWTPLHDASAEGQPECAAILIDSGAVVDSENDDGNTPLHEAAKEGNDSTMQVLVDNNANINYVNDHGDSPLHMAVEIGIISCVKMLLESGAFPGCKNVDGISPQLAFDEDGFPISPGLADTRGESLYGKQEQPPDDVEPKGFLQRTRTRHTMRGAKKKKKALEQEAVDDLARRMSESAQKQDLNGGGGGDVDLTGKRSSSSSVGSRPSSMNLEMALQNVRTLALDAASARGSTTSIDTSTSDGAGGGGSFSRQGTTVDQIEKRSRSSSASVAEDAGEGYEYDANTALPATQRKMKKEAEKETKRKAKEQKAEAKKAAAKLKGERKAQKKAAKEAKKADKAASKLAAKAAKAAAAKEAAVAKAAKAAKEAAEKEAAAADAAAEEAQAAAFAADLSAAGEAVAGIIEEANDEYDAMGELHAAAGRDAMNPAANPGAGTAVAAAAAAAPALTVDDGEDASDGLDGIASLPPSNKKNGRAASKHQGSLIAMKKARSVRTPVRQPGATAPYSAPVATEEPVVLGVVKSPTGLDISYAMDAEDRLRVVDTAPRGAAEKAGIWLGAAILEINGLPVDSLEAAENALHEAQDETNITYFKVAPCDDEIPEMASPTRARRKSQMVRRDGETYYKTIVVRQTAAATLPFQVADTEDGVVVISSTLDEIRTGTRILGIMGEKVVDANQFLQLATSDKFTLDVEAT